MYFLPLDGTYFIEGVEIIPIFDVVHMEKRVRNNWLKKYLEEDYSSSKPQNQRIFGSWEYVQMAYEMDAYELSGDRERRLPKLTDRHIYEKSMKKMSVKHCIQALSKSTGEEINRLIDTQGLRTIKKYLIH